MAKKQRGFSYERAAKSLQENASNSGAVAGASYTLVGGIILLGAIGYGIYVTQKANAYNEAFAAYQRRRAAVQPEDFR